MRRLFLLTFFLALLFGAAVAPADAESDGGQATELPAPQGDAPSVTFNQTGVFEPQDLERITLEIPREGSTYVTFQKRFVVTSGSATKNIQMDFTFSSIILKHTGTTPGSANISLRMVDGRTVFVAARSMSRTGEDRFAYIR